MISIPASLLLFILSAVAEPSRHPASNRELQNQFMANNNAWFDGKLDPNTKVEFVPDLRDWRGNRVMGVSAASPPWWIKIDAHDRDNSAVWDETLFHEQCHQKVNAHGGEFDEHGPKWHACMHGLVNAGAFDVDKAGHGIL